MTDSSPPGPEPSRRASSRQTTPADACPLPPPLDEQAWAAVICELALAPQQERIVRRIMRSMPDKQIARELGLAMPTVRTYLGRVFERAGVQDRVQLVHRVYAIAFGAWTDDAK